MLVLEHGDGSGAYKHGAPVLHGLWPSVPPWGTSQCREPADSTPPSFLAPCYSDLAFEDHEWSKHGLCAGAPNAEVFFAQVCDLSAEPLALAKASSREEAQQALTAKGYVVVPQSDDQLGLLAYATDGSQWTLCQQSDTNEACH
jgi:hypothetical protein